MNSSEISSSRAGQTEAARETQLPGRAIGVVGALIALFLAGCGPDPHQPNMPLQEVSAVSQPGGRFAVSRVGIFEDGNAYSGKRGIYVLRDSETGREYVGISGVGISELGQHQSGKTSVTDER